MGRGIILWLIGFHFRSSSSFTYLVILTEGWTRVHRRFRSAGAPPLPPFAQVSPVLCSACSPGYRKELIESQW